MPMSKRKVIQNWSGPSSSKRVKTSTQSHKRNAKKYRGTILRTPIGRTFPPALMLKMHFNDVFAISAPTNTNANYHQYQLNSLWSPGGSWLSGLSFAGHNIMKNLYYSYSVSGALVEINFVLDTTVSGALSAPA